MNRVLHIKLTAGEIFLNDINKNMSLGNTTLLNEEIISKRLVLNALLNLIGETPISYKNTSNFLFKIRNNEIEDINYKSPWIDTLKECIEKSYYKLNEENIFKINKNGKRQYNINLRQGLRSSYSERNCKDSIRDVKVSGYISWNRLYQCFSDKKYFDEWCDKIKDILNYDPETKPLKNVIIDLIDSDESQIEKIKIMIEEFDKKRANTNVLNILEAILYSKGCLSSYKTIHLERGSDKLHALVEIKHSISVEGELYIVLPEEIVEYIETHYVPTRMFDGGMFIIENVFDAMDKNTTKIMNEGFKPMSELTF